MDTSIINAADAKTIDRLAREGKSIHDIRTKLENRYSYELIQGFMWDHGCLSLQGAKNAVSRQLTKLRTAGQRKERIQIASDIRWYVDYIYYAGKDTQKKLEKCRKRVAALKKITEAEE